MTLAPLGANGLIVAIQYLKVIANVLCALWKSEHSNPFAARTAHVYALTICSDKHKTLAPRSTIINIYSNIHTLFVI